MQVKIYQIDPHKKKRGLLFRSYTQTLDEDGNVNPDLYHKIFDGDINTDNLEEIYNICNCDHPKNYKGWSMSVGDIVETETGCFYVDTFGFVKLDNFDTSNIPEREDKRYGI